MTLPIVTIRPEPGASFTVATGDEEGLEVAAFPLFAVRPLPWQAPDPETVDGLLLGSANAIRHGGPELERVRALPAWCVGQATAAAARDAGFRIAAIGTGGLQQVLDGLAGQRLRLLRLSGAERVPLAAPEGVAIAESTVYETRAMPLPNALEATLRDGALVLLHSAAAARHLASEVDRLEIARGRIALAALGPRIADAAGTGWHAIRSAEMPSDEALLSLARLMCQ